MERIAEQIIQWRRHIHENPERSYEEYETVAFVEKQLSTMPHLQLQRLTDTSIVATLKGVKKGKCVALRADLDALPIQEETTVPFKSKVPGMMHSCGHDAHTAMLLGAAKILSERGTQFEGEIRFIFQHGEEVAPGGAVDLVSKGVMNHVDFVFALHVHPSYETGTFAMRSGKMNAAGDDFFIHVYGKGGHAAEPHKTIDPLFIGTAIVQALQASIARKIKATTMPVLSVTMFQCGKVPNIIEDVALIGGTIRSHDEKVRVASRQIVEKTAHCIAALHGATASVQWQLGCAAVINDKEATEIGKQVAAKIVGKENVVCIEEPLFVAEDFAAYCEVVPGSIQLLGVHHEKLGTAYPLHHAKFMLDESALFLGTQYFTQIAEKICGKC
ncbi:M20 metallopeptidase family protein [Kurthia senegalensis]|uniref:M20 metallopeptidase family protein n=1 Tax=Kurthia senegalensis TaxID=1033740 RepID=UPI00028950E7|nr:amidohydrolase [Kurthia senegalensis]